MTKKETLENADIREIEDNQNLYALKSLLEEFKKEIALQHYIKNLFHLYKTQIYKNPHIKLNYKLAQEIFYRWNKNISKIEVLTKLFPKIDFSDDKKYVQEIKEVKKRYNKNYSEKISLLLAIQDFINKHISYPFFLAFYISKQQNIKISINTKITNQDRIFIQDILINDKEFNLSDPFLKKFQIIIKNWTENEIKSFLLNHFNNLSSNNQRLLLDYFSNKRKNKWIFMYSYLSKTSIKNIVEKYKTWYCTHIALITKHFFNKIYKKKDAKILFLLNIFLNHAYNLLIIKENNKTKFIYIDILWDKSKLIEDHHYHKFDFIIK